MAYITEAVSPSNAGPFDKVSNFVINGETVPFAGVETIKLNGQSYTVGSPIGWFISGKGPGTDMSKGTTIDTPEKSNGYLTITNTSVAVHAGKDPSVPGSNYMWFTTYPQDLTDIVTVRTYHSWAARNCYTYLFISKDDPRTYRSAELRANSEYVKVKSFGGTNDWVSIDTSNITGKWYIGLFSYAYDKHAGYHSINNLSGIRRS